MAHYAVIWKYTEDQRVIDGARSAHGEFIKELAARGILKEAGAWQDGSGALLVFDVSDQDELESLLSGDPYSTSGVITATSINAWNPVLGLVTE